MIQYGHNVVIVGEPMESKKLLQNKNEINGTYLDGLRKKRLFLQSQLQQVEDEIEQAELANKNEDPGLPVYNKPSNISYSSNSFFSMETIMLERGLSLTNDDDAINIVDEDKERGWDEEQNTSSDEEDYAFRDIPSGASSPSFNGEEGLFSMDDCASKSSIG